MEDVLEVYKRRASVRRPVVCLDETSKQLVAETRAPIPMTPGEPKRIDYEYRRCGVANASCFAIRDLFSRCPDAPGVILLQDDVVFTANWYERLVGQVGRVFQVGRCQGIVAGMHLDHRQKRRVTRTSPVRFCSAQCYLITRELFEDQRAWFDRTDHEPRNFDKWLCKLLRTKGFELRLLYPYVCQHIGVVSKVRPDTAFYQDDRTAGRVGLGCNGICAKAAWRYRQNAQRCAAPNNAGPSIAADQFVPGCVASNSQPT